MVSCFAAHHAGGSTSAQAAIAYAYTSRADGQAASVTFRPDTAQSTSFTTTYGYDANQHLTSAQINDGRPRRVEYVNDAQGQVLVRREADNTLYSAGTGKGGDPRAYNYYLNGIQVGSNSNNGNPDPDFGTALGERVARPTNGTGAFVGGADGGSTYADFDQAYDAVSPSNSGNGTARYTVRNGDTLQSIAASLFGDASLWYIIGEANGLTSSSALSAGQSLTVPGKISNFHNNADTFRPYDASKAIGDTAPTTPRPPKKPGCGVIGAVILAAVAVAVAVILKVPVTQAFSATTTVGTATVGAGIAGIGAVTATATAATLSTLGAIGAGAAIGAAAATASQLVGVATGLQNKFSFKGVALAALSGGVGGGISGVNLFGQASSLARTASDVARGALSNAAVQGVGVVSGLQRRFDFAGVAVGGVVAGVGGAVDRRFAVTGAATGVGPRSVAGYAQQTVAWAAAALAGAGARSLITGSSFGDNILAALPDVIGQTIGSVAANAATSPTRLTAKVKAVAAELGPTLLDDPTRFAAFRQDYKATLSSIRKLDFGTDPYVNANALADTYAPLLGYAADQQAAGGRVADPLRHRTFR